MADTTKLADSFPAMRLIVGVKPDFLDDALKHCRDLGLLPEVSGYQDGRHLIRVLVPAESEGRFLKAMQPFHAALMHGVKINLICPVAVQKTEE